MDNHKSIDFLAGRLDAFQSISIDRLTHDPQRLIRAHVVRAKAELEFAKAKEELERVDPGNAGENKPPEEVSDCDDSFIIKLVGSPTVWTPWPNWKFEEVLETAKDICRANRQPTVIMYADTHNVKAVVIPVGSAQRLSVQVYDEKGFTK